MKKTLSCLTALLLVTVFFPAAAEENAGQAAGPAGCWYGELLGFPAQLNLEEDGTYTLSLTGPEGESTAGTWTASDGEVVPDGDEAHPLLFADGRLFSMETGLTFTGEKPDIYVPAAPTEAALAESGGLWPDLDGVWTCAYILMAGEAVPARIFGENTILYMEGLRCALTGSLFGEMTAQFAVENGMLTLEDNGLTLLLQQQADGFLRLTVSDAEETLVLILQPAETADIPFGRKTSQE